MSTSVEQFIESDEGRRKKVYQCPAGKWTIGVGRNLEDRGLSDSEIDMLLANDVSECLGDMEELFHTVSFSGFTKARQAALISMRFQLGGAGVRKFTGMIGAIRMAQWSRAADEALDSLWARQTPERAQKIAQMLRSGEWPG